MDKTMRVSDRRGPKRVLLFGVVIVAALLFVAGTVPRVRAQTPGATPAQSNAPARHITVPPEVPNDAVRCALLLAGNNAGLLGG